MENLGQCSIDLRDVVRAFETSASLSLFLQKWRRFCSTLEIDYVKIREFQLKLNLETLEFGDLPREILKHWKSETGRNATLQVLHSALVDCELTDIAEFLVSNLITPENLTIWTKERKLLENREDCINGCEKIKEYFHDKPILIKDRHDSRTLSIKLVVVMAIIASVIPYFLIPTREQKGNPENMEGGILDLQKIKTLKLNSQGNLVTLKELVGESATQGFYQKVSHEIHKGLFDKPLQILSKRIQPPAQPKYYINRTLLFVDSTEVDVGMLPATGHVFLFKGTSKSDLAKASQHKRQIDKSSDQIHSMNVTFILLEHDEDFDQICRKTEWTVHVIQREGKRYFWLKSNKNFNLVRQFLKEQKKTINEKDFVSTIASLTAPFIFSIADSPGTGKTFLIANMANTIRERQPTTITLFIVLSEFAQLMNLVDSNSTVALEAVAEYATSNEIAKLVLLELMKFHQVYLFLDGYDEVPEEKLYLIDTFLNHLKQVNTFKIIVTTNLKRRDHMENMFQQFSYEILPLNESNQITLMTKYWIDQHETTNGSELDEFARNCLAALETNLSDKEKEIAGIPLRCMILSQVFAENAKKVSSGNNLSTKKIKPMRLFTSYQRLIDIKIRKSQTQGMNEILRCHICEAVKLLFPEWVDNFCAIEAKIPEKIDKTELHLIGLLEKGPNENATRFIHRTFAEFLFAEFVVNNLFTNPQCVKFFFSEIMGRNENEIDSDFNFDPTTEVAFKLKYPVIMYFIEMHLKQRSSGELLPDYSLFENIDGENVCVSVRACCSMDFEGAFNYATKFLLHRISSIGVPNFRNMQRFSMEGCKDDRMLRKVLEYSHQHFGVNISYHVIQLVSKDSSASIHKTLLHESASKGEYNKVVTLLPQYRDGANELKFLLHACVSFSANDKDFVLDEKKLVIEALVSANRSWINEQNEDGLTPLLQPYVHPKLIYHLVELGADINACARIRGTVLHTSWELAQWAFSKGFKLVNYRDFDLVTPLMNIIRRQGTVDDAVMEMFIKAGADLDLEDINGNSFLFYALAYSWNLEFIKKVIKLGVDLQHKNKMFKNALHIFMERQNMVDKHKLATLDMLVRTNPNWINEKDFEGRTPLLAHCSISRSSKFNLKLLQRLVEHGADINTYSKEHGTILHAYTYDRDTYKELVRWAFSSGFNLFNHNDRYDRTPFMHALKLFVTLDDELVQLFKEAGVNTKWYAIIDFIKNEVNYMITSPVILPLPVLSNMN